VTGPVTVWIPAIAGPLPARRGTGAQFLPEQVRGAHGMRRRAVRGGARARGPMARTVHSGKRMKNRMFALRTMFAAGSLVVLGACGSGEQKSAGRSGGPIEVTVTSEGFQPAEIEAKAGQPLRLVITRKTDKTCAKEIVIKELGLEKPLPLDQPVTVEFTPQKTGQLRYACSMDMIAGVILVK
jgi:plastocyanin